MAHKFFKSKKMISIFSSLSILVVGSGVIAVSIITTRPKSQDEVYYKFNDNLFKTNEQLMEYVNTNAQVQSYSSEDNYYLYNNKSYEMDDFSSLQNEMMTKTPIKEYSTYRDPSQYLVDSANQVSNQALTPIDDQLTTVYRGKDDNAYLSKTDAINSYHDYQKIYQLGNSNDQSTSPIEFQNKAEAIQYLENVVEQNLDNDKQTDRYEMAGSFFTRDQILTWLKSTTDIQYDYNGYRWSRLNHPDSSQMQLTQQDIYDYIQVYNPPKTTYWLDVDSRGMNGSFSGPLYIEMDEEPKEAFISLQDKLRNNWKEISKTTINASLSSLVLFSSLINCGMNTSTDEEDRGWDINADFFSYTEKGAEQFAESFTLANHSNYNEEGTGFAYKVLNDNLNSFVGMSRWQKTLVFLQNVYNYTLTTNHAGAEDQVVAFLDLLQTMLKNVITNNTSMFDTVLDDIFKTNNTLEKTNDRLTLTDIIHIFISPAKFMYESPSKVAGLDNAINEINSIGNTIFDSYDEFEGVQNQNEKMTDKEVESTLESFETYLKGGQKYYLIDGQKVDANEAYNQVASTLKDNLSVSKDGSKIDLSKAFKPVSKVGQFAGKFFAGFEIAKAVWDLGNLVSPFEWVVYQNDLGNGQVLQYQATEFKIPILDIKLTPPPGETIPIKAIPLFTIGTIGDPYNEVDDKQTYIVFGSLIVGYDSAKQYLKDYIIAHPNNFTSTRSYYISIMSQQEQQQLAIDLETATDSTDKLDEFINIIFDKYFKNKAVKMYFDGIDEFFNNAIDAKNSLKNKITNNEFIIKYKFTDLEGISKYYDDPESLLLDQDAYIEANVLESKTILQTDLIKTINYDKLTAQTGKLHKVYGVNFNGQEHYFLTADDAKSYVYHGSDVVLKTDNVINYYVYFGEQIFTNESDFYKWVKDNTQIVNQKGELIKNGN